MCVFFKFLSLPFIYIAFSGREGWREEGKRINVALIIIISFGFCSPLGAQTKIRVFSAAVSHRLHDDLRTAAAETRRPIAFRTRPLVF